MFAAIQVQCASEYDYDAATTIFIIYASQAHAESGTYILIPYTFVLYVWEHNEKHVHRVFT